MTIYHCSVCDKELGVQGHPLEDTLKGPPTISVDPCTTCLDEEYTKGLEADFVA